MSLRLPRPCREPTRICPFALAALEAMAVEPPFPVHAVLDTTATTRTAGPNPIAIRRREVQCRRSRGGVQVCIPGRLFGSACRVCGGLLAAQATTETRKRACPASSPAPTGPKRPQRKTRAKAVAINEPAIVRRDTEPADEAAASTGAASMSVITRPQTEDARRNRWVDDGQEISPEEKAFFARMMRPYGAS